jgi:ATP-dependent RNA helicase SUPV3L1/SUV3
VLQWRNSKLDFPRSARCRYRLALTPTQRGADPRPDRGGLRVLDHAARDGDVRDMGAWRSQRGTAGMPARSRITARSRRPRAELVTTLFGFLMQKG